MGTPPLLKYIAFFGIFAIASGLFYTYGNSEEPDGRSETYAEEQEQSHPCMDPQPREKCSSVELDSASYRYSLVTGSGEETLLIDLGGPGTSVLSGEINLADFAASLELPEKYNFLFIEEPWVRSEISDKCNQGLTDFYLESRSLEAQNPSSSSLLVDLCDLDNDSESWGFSEDSYTKIVQEIENTEGIHVSAFLGYSFGSARLAYLGDVEFEWISLIRPYPVGASGEDLTSTRARQASRIFPEENANDVKPHTYSEVEGRSISVNEFDYLSAELAVGYYSPESIESYSHDLSSRSNDRLAGQLSDSFWLRYGEDRISPGYLAYISEVCRLSESWPEVEYDSNNHMAILSRMHSPCLEIEGSNLELSTTSDNFCVVLSESDPLTSPQLIRDSMNLPDDAIMINSKEISHGSSDGTVECVQVVTSEDSNDKN